jgi:hypothetical protein
VTGAGGAEIANGAAAEFALGGFGDGAEALVKGTEVLLVVSDAQGAGADTAGAVGDADNVEQGDLLRGAGDPPRYPNQQELGEDDVGRVQAGEEEEDAEEMAGVRGRRHGAVGVFFGFAGSGTRTPNLVLRTRRPYWEFKRLLTMHECLRRNPRVDIF